MRGGSSPQKGGQAAQALGRSRGGFSTKIHVSVDGLGNPLRFILTGGQQHDITQAEELIAGYAGEHVLADKGYDAQEFRQHILELGMMPVIPPRSNRKAPADYDRHRYRERHLVECFINKIKHWAGYSPFSDGLGFLIHLTGGQQHDITQAEELIAGYAGEHVLADKGYDAQEFRQHILELGMMPVIPPRWRFRPARTARHPPTMTGIGTGSAIWWNASSTRSSTIAGYSPGLRSWTPDTWASCISPPLSSGYGEMSTEPRDPAMLSRSCEPFYGNRFQDLPAPARVR